MIWKHLDLFSGIGGFALATEMVWPEVEHTFCEIDPFCKAILNKHWPSAVIHEDIKNLEGGGALVQLTFLPEDFRVSRSRVLGSEEERKTTGISGRRCYELYGRFVRGGSSVKTLVASLLGTEDWSSRACSLIWKQKVTKSHHRLLFQLAVKTHRTAATGFGLLLTPSVVMPEEPPGQMRARALRKGYDNGTQWNSLASQIRYGFLPTPLASDHKRSVESETQYARRNTPQRKRLAGTNNLVNAVGMTNGKRNGRRLSPGFALWMMGYPEDWLDLEAGEMPRSKVRVTR